MRLLKSLLLTWLWIMYEANPSEAKKEDPAQQECLLRGAVLFNTAFLSKVNAMLILKFLLLRWATLRPKKIYFNFLLSRFASILYQ